VFALDGNPSSAYTLKTLFMTIQRQYREDAETIWRAGLAAVEPRPALGRILRRKDAGLEVDRWQWIPKPGASVILIGAGKAAAAMATAVVEILSEPNSGLTPIPLRGLVNVLDEQAGQAGPIRLHGARPAGNPLPTDAGVVGSQAMLDLVRTAGPDDLVLCLISGGASALLPCPPPGVSIADKRALTALLSRRGADIRELNVVRKHLSQIKGGQLAAAGRAGLWVSLILSDVIGNPLDVIASGPTVPDPSTFTEAWAVLEKYHALTEAPPSCLNHLQRGRNGLVPENLKQLPDTIHNLLIADNDSALNGAATCARKLGYAVHNLGSNLAGESWEVGVRLAKLGRDMSRGMGPIRPPACVISGGETVVSHVAPDGKGGRNQELALAFLSQIPADDRSGITLLSAGTDGEDGPTDAAGAWADGTLRAESIRLGLDIDDFRQRSCSYDFFHRIKGLFITGPTGTNVMDLRILLIPTRQDP
jgi:hydroxypyruvate reductase/glycerate 2-kinase